MSYLELRDISKVYGEGAAEVHALQRVDLSVDAGSLVAVMGASGSGKSTLLTIAGSLEDATSGEVYVGGRVAVVAVAQRQGAAAAPVRSATSSRTTTCWPGSARWRTSPCRSSSTASSARKAQAAALESLEDFGLADRASHYPDQMSGGERQRVAIARAVVGGRQLLLADEPSGALDSTNAEAVMRLILAACHRGLAAVVVTHDAQLASWADRVIFLRDGRIVDQTLPLESPEAFLAEAPEADERRRPRTAGHRVGARTDRRRRPARRAMLRWSWRLFKREWRQQFLILLLIIVAVAAVVVGSAVAVNTPPPANAGFGTAHDLATFNLTPDEQVASDSLPYVEAQIAQLEHAVGTVQVIANETFTVPGSTQTYQLRSQDPHGPYGGPMLQLLSRALPDRAERDRPHPGPGVRAQPAGRRHVAPRRQDRRRHRAEPPEPARRVRARAARPGDAPDAGERPLRRIARRLIAEHLSSYVTTPGVDQQQHHQPVDHRAGAGDRRHAPDRPGVDRRLHRAGAAPHALPRHARVHGGDRPQRPARPGGQRRHRRARGCPRGLRARAWCCGWPTARPTSRTRTTSFAMFALPWNVIVPAMVLAVIATFFAAGYPARAITRVPVVSALAGRPAPPRQIHRSLVPGVVALVLGFIFFSISGAVGERRRRDLAGPRAHRADRRGSSSSRPFFLALLARVGRPVAHRHPPAAARHGALPGPLGLGTLGHQPRHHDRGHRLRRGRRPLRQRLRLRRAEHGGERDQRVHPAAGRHRVVQPGAATVSRPAAPAPSLSAQEATVHAIASAVGATHVVELDNPAVGLQNPSGAAGNGTARSTWRRRPFCGPTASTPRPSRPTSTSSARGPGLAGSGVQLTYGGGGKGGGGF